MLFWRKVQGNEHMNETSQSNEKEKWYDSTDTNSMGNVLIVKLMGNLDDNEQVTPIWIGLISS